MPSLKFSINVLVAYDLFSVVLFLLGCSLLILSLPFLGLSSKSTSLRPGFSVHRPRQYDTICWELDLFQIFYFFLDDCLGGWSHGCGWCLAGGRGC